MSKTKSKKTILFHLSNEEIDFFHSKKRREKKLLMDSIKAENKILADNYSRG